MCHAEVVDSATLGGKLSFLPLSLPFSFVKNIKPIVNLSFIHNKLYMSIFSLFFKLTSPVLFVASLSADFI